MGTPIPPASGLRPAQRPICTCLRTSRFTPTLLLLSLAGLLLMVTHISRVIRPYPPPLDPSSRLPPAQASATLVTLAV